ncbi:HD domain-containing protein [Dyadobacter sp. CY345]|uniref:HD domain-containing protein n=1 Tax=Dyadobacter sp. CY345 TaxID=2909335 RepID=UPI001F28C8A2|nr:HD domain-containing protein [Dyadobacter sp. CY345]MCF2443486.1 HD domain-containing protein [Dyadobacter sp. CY345]
MTYSIKIIDDLLEPFRMVIGADFNRYRNHVYRVYLNCLLIDNAEINQGKYAIAAVFHDIGIWTDHTIDYLNPSIVQAGIYLKKIKRVELLEEISLMIYWHHKISGYEGKNQRVVENFRKADWIDVSLGILTFGFDKKIISQNRKNLPNLGFHFFLLKKTTKNFFKHPLNPLPMFTK